MATNSVTWTGSYGQYSRLYIEFNLVSQHTTNNTSTFSYKVRGQSTDVNAGISWYSGSLQLSNAYSKTKAIGGGSFNYSTEFVFDSGTFTVSHNAEGKLSTRTLTAYVTLTSGHNATVSVSLSVPDIKRASQPRLNVSTQNLGSSITIYTDRASTSFTHTLSYAFGNQSGTIATGVGDSTAWTLPNDLAWSIPNNLSGVGGIYCDTYSGDTFIGSKGISFTATVPDNATFQPTATINSIVEGDTLPSGITVFVRNQSKVKVTSSGTGKYNATINTYSVAVANIGTYTGSVITSDTLRNSGTVRVTLTVTDSRGLKGSTYQDIEVVEYSPPQLPTFNAIRSETTPENILASFDASVSPINNQNNKLFRIRSKASDGDWVVETSSTESYTFSGTQTIWSDPDKSYTIEFFIQDSFTSITQTVQVGTAFTLMNFNTSGKGVAIGKVSESDSFEVAMPIDALKGVAFMDTRSVSDLPQDLPSRAISFDFKSRSSVNNPPTYASDIYSCIITVAGWSTNEGSGGWPTQLSVGNNGISYRAATSATSWSEWDTMWGSSNSNVMTDSGSNANGRYIKFSDGTLFCSGEFSVTASGNIIDITKSFPANSTVAQIIIPSLGDNGQSNWAGNLYTASSAGDSYRLVAVNCVTNGNYKIRFASWGRWK